MNDPQDPRAITEMPPKDDVLREALAARPAHMPPGDLAARAIRRARAMERDARLNRLRRLQWWAGATATVFIGGVLWVGSSRLASVTGWGDAVAATTESASDSYTSGSSSTSISEDAVVAWAAPLLVAAGVFAAARALDRAPADVSPMLNWA